MTNASTPDPIKCPKCRHTWTPRPPRVRRFRVAKPASRATPTPPTVDTSTLSTAALFKHYHDSAPLEDVRFTLTHATLSPGLRFAFEVLEASIVELRIRDRKAIYREYVSLQQMWRHESNRRQWARQLLDTYACPVPADRLLPPASEIAA